MSLPGPEQRFELWMEEALASELAWGLESAGRLIRYRLQDGRLALPLWPSQESAALEAPDASEQPRRIGLDELLDGLLPAAAAQHEALAIYPLKGAAFIIEAQQLVDRLMEAWDEDD